MRDKHMFLYTIISYYDLYLVQIFKNELCIIMKKLNFFH